MVRTVLKSFNAPFGNKVVQKMDLASDMGGGRSCAIGMVGRTEPAPSWVTEHLASRQGEWDGGGKALFKHHLLSTSREEAYRESASAEEDKRGDLNSQSTSSHQAFAARGAAQCAVHRVNPS